MMRARKRVTLMVITVSVIFGVCWSAKAVDLLFVAYISTLTVADVTYATTSTLILFNSAINPIVYALVSQRFRKKMKLMMGCSCRLTTNRIMVYTAGEPQRRLQVQCQLNHSPYPEKKKGNSKLGDDFDFCLNHFHPIGGKKVPSLTSNTPSRHFFLISN